MLHWGKRRTENQSPAHIIVPLQEIIRESTRAGFLNGNRKAANGMPLHYITPEVVESNHVVKLENQI